MTAERRWIIGLVVALTVSLAGNLLVAGVVASRWFDRPPPPLSFAGPSMIEGLFEDLSPEGSKIMRSAMHEARRDLRPTFGELREARQEVRRLLEAEDFDRAAFDAAMARVDTLGDTVEARMEKGFADAVGQLSAEDRRRFKPGRPDRGRPDRDRPDRDRMGPPPEGMPPGAPPEPLP